MPFEKPRNIVHIIYTHFEQLNYLLNSNLVKQNMVNRFSIFGHTFQRKKRQIMKRNTLLDNLLYKEFLHKYGEEI